MITGSIEYNRPIKVIRQTGGFQGTPVHYDIDLTQSHLDLELQDKATREFYSHITASIVPTNIKGPATGVTEPSTDGDYIEFEFILPKPSEVPTGSVWIVEWNTNEYEALDYFEFEVHDKTSDELYIERFPFA